ncbi:MAG: hypothetical protein CM1200mP41_17480 [Gammaproteobacteria bacterium]|nr:MAG: hypothetical protein CM1200mP41_17480 [Gammaproteobacteria bacterium]
MSELIGIAGGDDIFPELATRRVGRVGLLRIQRRLSSSPDIIIGSWCGKKFRPEKVAARPGWQAIPAVANGDLHEIKSAEILQPGRRLNRWARSLTRIIQDWQQREGA